VVLPVGSQSLQVNKRQLLTAQRRNRAGVLASLAELELELGRERRAAAREARRARGQHNGRPKALDEKKAALAMRMRASGEAASTIANALGVSRSTVPQNGAQVRDLKLTYLVAAVLMSVVMLCAARSAIMTTDACGCPRTGRGMTDASATHKFLVP
jgi:hypothetical protein